MLLREPLGNKSFNEPAAKILRLDHSQFWFYRELCGKVIKPLFFKVPLAASGQHHPCSLVKGLCGYSPHRGVFLPQGARRLRRGRRGFASFAQGHWRLRIKTGSRSSLQRTRSPCVLCEAFAPIALQKHRNAVKKHANFSHTIPSRTTYKGCSSGF
jgi:hypothetical protein